jgi:hypothetical protein
MKDFKNDKYDPQKPWQRMREREERTDSCFTFRCSCGKHWGDAYTGPLGWETPAYEISTCVIQVWAHMRENPSHQVYVETTIRDVTPTASVIRASSTQWVSLPRRP